jgi:hypothetical protein
MGLRQAGYWAMGRRIGLKRMGEAVADGACPLNAGLSARQLISVLNLARLGGNLSVGQRS